VFHLAAQALVRRSYRDPLDTFETNVLGTANVLEAVRQLDRPCAVVVVTSDKCYENPEDLHPHREADPMGGADPYSASKGCAELVAAAYRRSFFSERSSKILVASARAGNVIGPGDWAEDRLVPDAVRALQAGRSILVRRPAAIRPWQHVLEPLSGYLRLATVLLAPGGQRFAEAWNFGPEPASALSVAELVDLLVREWGRGSWHAGDGTGPSEARYLRLSIRKAAARLAWRPAWTVKQAVRETVEGYRAFGLCRGDAEQARRVMDEAIARYTASARRK
jgi:CDP-glucose 4,6-dehydratase